MHKIARFEPLELMPHPRNVLLMMRQHSRDVLRGAACNVPADVHVAHKLKFLNNGRGYLCWRE